MGQSLVLVRLFPWPRRPDSIFSSAVGFPVWKRISIRIKLAPYLFHTPVGSISRISRAKFAAVIKLFIL
jgi:hypothetical protein